VNDHEQSKRARVEQRRIEHSASSCKKSATQSRDEQQQQQQQQHRGRSAARAEQSKSSIKSRAGQGRGEQSSSRAAAKARARAEQQQQQEQLQQKQRKHQQQQHAACTQQLQQEQSRTGKSGEIIKCFASSQSSPRSTRRVGLEPQWRSGAAHGLLGKAFPCRGRACSAQCSSAYNRRFWSLTRTVPPASGKYTPNRSPTRLVMHPRSPFSSGHLISPKMTTSAGRMLSTGVVHPSGRCVKGTACWSPSRAQVMPRAERQSRGQQMGSRAEQRSKETEQSRATERSRGEQRGAKDKGKTDRTRAEQSGEHSGVEHYKSQRSKELRIESMQIRVESADRHSRREERSRAPGQTKP
jgi:hypothetical protein